MNPVEFATRKPVTILVGVIVVTLFGLLALFRLPVQLTPDVDRPLLTVQTFWEGAAPQEVEEEIVHEQEERLKRVQGMRQMISTASEGSAQVQLEFDVGMDTSRALLDVTDKLRQVREYPENVDQPTVSAGETEGAGAIAWFILGRDEDSPHGAEDLPFLQTLMEEDVKPRLERAAGVASVGIVGGVGKEVHLRIDSHRLAARGLTLMDVRDAIRQHNVDVSAGSLDQGKASYLVRTVGRFEDLSELERLVIARRDGTNVLLRDVGTVAIGFKDYDRVVRSLGQPAIAVNAQRQSGSNVIEVMAALQQAVAEVNRDILGPEGLHLRQVYDQTQYIHSAIDLVLQNLWVGGLLAVLVLLVFLRDGRSTLVIALAIPISTIGAFLALTLLGRNLNVVSLAGFAFAVGMVVDNSIVVLENIHRKRSQGLPALQAAREGCQEVWGAVLASTLTTLAVFIPVVFVKDEAGQLFRDIAIAISAAVGLSLVVSVLFIPMATSRTMRRQREVKHGVLYRLGGRLNRGIVGTVAFVNRTVWRRIVTVVGFTGGAIFVSWLLLPPMSYLPTGNQNLCIGFLIPPPGYNAGELTHVAEAVESALAPYWEPYQRGEALPAELARPPWYQGDGRIPLIENFFFVAFGQTVFMGARSAEEGNVEPLLALIEQAGQSVPGAMVFASQRSLFERGINAGNSIDLEVTGHDMAEIQSASLALMARITPVLGRPRAEPSNFQLGTPELRVHPDPEQAADLGLSVRDVGFLVQSLVDGAYVGDYRHEGVSLDMKLLPPLDATPDLTDLNRTPVYTPTGRVVPLSHFATLSERRAPTQIRHVEERRAIKLSVTPPKGMELSTAMDVLQQDIVSPMQADGTIPESVSVLFSGTADKLQSTRESLQWNFGLAVLLTFLLLSALFESFLYPLVILFSVPLAAVGGIVGLRIVHEFTGHELDVLTMLGFVILVGTVVNNAILIVHQGLRFLREGMEEEQAVQQAVGTRVRPIFMSTLTSVLGMTPLVLFPGAGSELYRGLGSVVVGGLIASTLFTLLVVPTLFRLVLGMQRRLGGTRPLLKQTA